MNGIIEKSKQLLGRPFSVESKIKLITPGEGCYEQMQNWRSDERVRVGEYIPDDDDGKWLELISDTRIGFDRWLQKHNERVLGCNRREMFTTDVYSEDMETTGEGENVTQIETLGYYIVVVPVERGDNDWANGDMFEEAQKMAREFNGCGWRAKQPKL